MADIENLMERLKKIATPTIANALVCVQNKGLSCLVSAIFAANF